MNGQLLSGYDVIYDWIQDPHGYPNGLVSPHTIYGLNLRTYNYLKIYIMSTDGSNATSGIIDMQLWYTNTTNVTDGYPWRASYVCIDNNYYDQNPTSTEQRVMYYIQCEVNIDKNAFGINKYQGYIRLYDGSDVKDTSYLKVVRVEGRY